MIVWSLNTIKDHFLPLDNNEEFLDHEVSYLSTIDVY